jgi:hypothetical protein
MELQGVGRGGGGRAWLPMHRRQARAVWGKEILGHIITGDPVIPISQAWMDSVAPNGGMI